MTGVSASGLNYRQRTDDLHSKWGWFLVLGLVLAICGAGAIALPAVSNYAASVVLGAALVMAFAIMGGLLIGTILTLIFLPTLYVTWFMGSEKEAAA